MKTLARITAIIAGVMGLIAFIPLLGWMYWMVIPMGVVALIFSFIGNSKGGKVVSIIVIIIGLIRLSIGGGFI